jgi:hypothetical protein
LLQVPSKVERIIIERGIFERGEIERGINSKREARERDKNVERREQVERRIIER